MKSKILLSVGGVFLLASAAFAATQGLRQHHDGRVGGAGLRGRFERIQRSEQRFAQPRMNRQRGEIARRLGVTDDQRALAKSIAQQLRPLADALRPQAKEIAARARAAARSGDRAGARAIIESELKPLIESARLQARPLVRPLIQTLSAEQRAKIEAFVAARGRTFDENKLADRIALRLARLGHATRSGGRKSR